MVISEQVSDEDGEEPQVVMNSEAHHEADMADEDEATVEVGHLQHQPLCQHSTNTNTWIKIQIP